METVFLTELPRPFAGVAAPLRPRLLLDAAVVEVFLGVEVDRRVAAGEATATVVDVFRVAAEGLRDGATVDLLLTEPVVDRCLDVAAGVEVLRTICFEKSFRG